MPADEGQQILESLNQAQVSNRQWNVANSSPVQTPDQLSGGMLASMNAQMQMMQQKSENMLNVKRKEDRQATY